MFQCFNVSFISVSTLISYLQVKDCLKQNEELRGVIDRLRADQAREALKCTVESHGDGVNEISSQPPAYTSEILSLKVCP